MQHSLRLSSFVSFAAVLCLPATNVALAQQLRPRQSTPHQAGVTLSGTAALRARAKVSADSAMKIAHARVPAGKVQSGELEDEDGRLIYSFDINVPGKTGIDEVNVDAITGAVVAHEHESPAVERQEAASEARLRSARKPPL